jgi:hypothetical protein
MYQIAVLLFCLSSSPNPLNSPLPLNEISVNNTSSIEKTKTTNFNVVLEDSIVTLYNTIGLNEYGLNFNVFRFGMIGYFNLQQQGKLSDKNFISIIDFTKKSTEKRFYTIDLAAGKVVYHTYVSHGKNTGDNEARSFSNRIHSNQSSLGFYVTGETYTGSKGYSLRLDGVDKGYNDNMRQRAVVMHEAAYVSETWIQQYGRLGRSQGCPALPKELNKKVIDTIKNKTVIFAYYSDDVYLKSSAHLNNSPVMEDAVASNALPVSSGSN